MPKRGRKVSLDGTKSFEWKEGFGGYYTELFIEMFNHEKMLCCSLTIRWSQCVAPFRREMKIIKRNFRPTRTDKYGQRHFLFDALHSIRQRSTNKQENWLSILLFRFFLRIEWLSLCLHLLIIINRVAKQRNIHIYSNYSDEIFLLCTIKSQME